MQGASQKAVDTYRRIAQATPRDPQAQLQLAQTAQSAADYQTAVAAYKEFLRLAPDDQNAPFVRQQVKQLEAQLKQAQAAQAAQSAQPAAS